MTVRNRKTGSAWFHIIWNKNASNSVSVSWLDLVRRCLTNLFSYLSTYMSKTKVSWFISCENLNPVLFVLILCIILSMIVRSFYIIPFTVLQNLSLQTLTWLMLMNCGRCFMFLDLKKPSSIFLTFSNFWRFQYHKKAHIFLRTHDKFYSWKVFRLEDNGNHDKAFTVRYSQLLYTTVQSCFVNPNGLTISTEIWHLHAWSDDSSNETKN